jgi:hypothetical protein
MSGVIEFIGVLRVDILTPPECIVECAKRKQPVVQLYRTVLPFVILSLDHGRTEVPAGFITDFGSVPPMARPYISNENPVINPGALGHDYRYTYQIGTREQADDLFRACLLACGCRPTQAWLVWKMVRLFGASHWKS